MVTIMRNALKVMRSAHAPVIISGTIKANII